MFQVNLERFIFVGGRETFIPDYRNMTHLLYFNDQIYGQISKEKAFFNLNDFLITMIKFLNNIKDCLESINIKHFFERIYQLTISYFVWNYFSSRQKHFLK